MRGQTHFVQKQKLYFDFSSEVTARSWNKDTSDFYYRDIVPVLNRAFDRYIPADQLYSIETLEIDLGKILPNELKKALEKKIEQKLKTISRKYNSATPFSSSSKPNARTPLQKGITILHEASDKLVIKLAEDHILEIFFTFLDHGLLPWNSNIDSIKKLEDSLVEQCGIERLVRQHDFLKRVNLPSIRKRLLNQVSTSFLEKVLCAAFPKELEVISFYQTLMKQRMETAFVDARLKRTINEIISDDIFTWICVVDSIQPEDWPKDVIHSIIKKIKLESRGSGDKQFHSSVMEQILFTEGNQSSVLLRQVTEIIRSFESDISPRAIGEKSSITSPQKSGGDKRNSETQNENLVPDVRAENGGSDSQENMPLPDLLGLPTVRNQMTHQTDKTNIKKDNKIILDEGASDSICSLSNIQKTNQKNKELKKRAQSKFSAGGHNEQTDSLATKEKIEKHEPETLTTYYVRHAGIILCWPYLNSLFDRIGYLSSTDFKEPGFRERAVHLLGYIASGQERCEEHELTIAKFLTSWPPELTLAKDINLLENERYEADNMLQNLILNWSILKNTSIDSLRSSFFQRDGKLRKEEVGWRLIVEQKSYDMLLDHLPYGISIIKLPWHKDILKVDWA